MRLSMECRTHGKEHPYPLCPERNPVECAREMLGAILAKKNVDAWFASPNPQLDGLTPQQVIDSGLAEIIRDFAWDIITGNPS